ncbi:Kelch repeat-containing protein [Aureliella helgolandensis]|uniref:N-acetylneuraminate epimerase n=1 Tax=Aureliella helgolandensis TaxID=2527968 RepID=A0A518G550_9BACT|nr:hypothetical protein [Aureliella helgolandensis]QDV23725.1 N-acetylneuraminate epimerase [Aureliella helgolandensis]
MNIMIKPLQIIVVAALAFGVLANRSQAHFPWLAQTAEGQPCYFFGEDPSDRTYKLPDSVVNATIQLLQADGEPQTLNFEVVENDDFMGKISAEKLPPNATLVSQVTFGIFRGSRLNYYTLHQSGAIPTSRDAYKTIDSTLKLSCQLVATETGLDVYLLWDGEPLVDANVNLYSEVGNQGPTHKSDAGGKVSYAAQDLEKGLNGIMVGHTIAGEAGKLDDQAYESAMHYLTATFVAPTASASKPASPASEGPGPEHATGLERIHTPLPESLTSFGAAVQGDYLYVFSGHSGDAHGFGADLLAEGFHRIKFDDPTAQWEELAQHDPAQSVALVSDGQYLYRIAGLSFLNRGADEESNFNSTTHFARYDAELNTWTDLAPLPEPRSSLDAVVLNRSIYVAGGWNLQGASSQDAPWHDTMLRFDLDYPAAGWHTLPGPGYQTRAISLAAYDDKIFLLGGIQATGMTRKVSVYDPATAAWSAGPELLSDSPMAGFATSSFAAGKHLYYTGSSGIIYRLSDDHQEWHVANRMFFPRMFLRLLPATPNRLLAVGGTGADGSGRMAVVESVYVGSDDIYTSDVPKQTRWSIPFPGRAVQSQSLVLQGTKLYALGGNASRAPHDFSKEALVDEAFAFDIGSQTVEQLPKLPQALQAGTAIIQSQTSKHQRLLLVGGLGFVDDAFGSLSSVYEYAHESKTWSTGVQQLPEPRAMLQGIAHEDAIWLVGGSQGRERGLAHSILHWWGDESPIAPLKAPGIPTPRRSFGGAVIGNEFFAVGGIGEGNELAQTVDVFSFTERTWRQITAPHTPRVFPSLVSTADKLYLHGGFTKINGHFAPATSLEVYDVHTNAWTIVSEQLTGISANMTMLNYNGRLLFYGVDDQRAGLAHFVLLDPAPKQDPELVVSTGFGNRASGESPAVRNSKLLMRRDSNKDGKLGRDELGDRLSLLIEGADTDKDSLLNMAELQAALEAQAAATEADNAATSTSNGNKSSAGDSAN